MIQAKFKEVAKQLGCEYDYKEVFIRSLGSTNIPISYHRITVEYKSVLIKLVYEFGKFTIAEIKSIIETKKDFPKISVSTKSQMKRLFSRNKRPFIVKCKDPLFKSYMLDSLESFSYCEMAQETQFEPEFLGVKKGEHYILTTSFYLGFDDKEMSILPSINLHKSIIDEVLG